MRVKIILHCLIIGAIPFFMFTGCGDLEPEMQDTRTVILNMDFDQRSSSRTSSFAPADLGNYKTHLIMVMTSENMVLTSQENLSNSNYLDYRSNQGEYVLYDSDREITLNMKLNTKMKIFAFLFRENYSIGGDPDYDLFFANRDAGYYGESQIITIDDRQSIPANIILNQVSGTDTGGDTDTLLDTTAPTANVTTATITTSGSAVVQSTETGTAYLVNTTVTVNNNIVNINGAYDNQKNSVAISLANTDTNLPATGLADGTYKVYAVDTAGNLSNASSNSVTVATTYNLPAPNNFSASGTSNTVTLSWNSVSGALSYTLYWDNVSGIDSSDNRITPISTDNYTHSGLDNGMTYYYKVAAADSTGTMGTLSSEVNASTPLPAPDNLSASGANNTITLTWNSVSGATIYTLYWGNVSGIDNSDTPITSITNDNYTHSSLDNGSIYYYKVAAVNSSGTGTLSSVASAILDQNIQVSKTFNGHTYALTSDLMNWDEASVNANTFGGYLTTINTKSENTFLTDEFWTSAAKPWHGADEQASEGTWLWDNGTTSGDNGLTDNLCGTKSNCLKSDATWLDGSRKWCTNNPNNSRNTNSESPAYLEYQNCGYIWNNDPNNKYGCWDDTQCSYDKKSIIEFDL